MPRDIRILLPTMGNMIIVTLLAVLGITAGKFIFTKWNVPGLGDLFRAA
jgi:hypothetical protein